MTNNLVDRVNGYGVYFRLITPILGILVTIIGTLILSQIDDIRESQQQTRADLVKYQTETRTYNTNHLSHHSIQDTMVMEKLAEIKAKQDIILRKLNIQ